MLTQCHNLSRSGDVPASSPKAQTLKLQSPLPKHKIKKSCRRIHFFIDQNNLNLSCSLVGIRQQISLVDNCESVGFGLTFGVNQPS